jgi:TonB-dependent receptor
MSTAETSQDYRYALYGDFDFDGEFVLTDNASSGFMFFNDLEDTVDDFAVDWTTFVSSGSSFGSFKGGIAYTTTDRAFAGRRLRFKHRNTSGMDLSLPPEELFVEANIRPDGFELEETTRPTDNYTAVQDIPAAYLQADWNFGKLRAIGGLRYEDSAIEVVTRDIFSPDAAPLVTTLDEQEWLPALSLVYRVGQAQNLRLSASQTVNRPEFRELAPFNFTDAVGGWDTKGNPELVSATIRSYDARWEWFPNASDVVAVSLFHKDFTNPIEAVVIEAITNIQSWENSQSATNSGLELEFRRTFNADGRHLFTTIANYSHIESEITIQEGSPLTNPTRPLVGQPDNVGNLVLEWQQPSWRSSARVLLNYAGEKVAYAGASGLPDVLEDARGSVDLSFMQGFELFGIACTAKVSGENLTDEAVEFSQGGQPFLYWEPGTSWKLSIGLTIF